MESSGRVGLRRCGEDVVPVGLRRTQAFHGGVQCDHGFRHVVAGGVGVEGAEDGKTLTEEGGEPAWVGSGSGGREAKAPWVDRLTADGIDGGLTEEDARGVMGEYREVTEVFLGTGGHTFPGAKGGSAKFGADRRVVVVEQEKHGVAPGIGIERAGVEEGLEEGGWKSAVMDQVLPHA